MFKLTLSIIEALKQTYKQTHREKQKHTVKHKHTVKYKYSVKNINNTSIHIDIYFNKQSLDFFKIKSNSSKKKINLIYYFRTFYICENKHAIHITQNKNNQTYKTFCIPITFNNP